MPLLDNPRHEIYAQELAKGSPQAAAYEAAGYKPSKPHACRLATNGNLRARVSEIMGGAAERAEVTVESLIRDAAEIQRLAIADKQYAAANSALIAKAKLAGRWIDKTGNTNRNVDINRLSDEEIFTRLAVISDEPVDNVEQWEAKYAPAGRPPSEDRALPDASVPRRRNRQAS